MKIALLFASLMVTVNASAYSLADSSVLTTATPLMSSATSSGSLNPKQAALIINDAQNFLQTGKLTAFLAQKINETQKTFEDASEEEALDLLLVRATNILKK